MHRDYYMLYQRATDTVRSTEYGILYDVLSRVVLYAYYPDNVALVLLSLHQFLGDAVVAPAQNGYWTRQSDDVRFWI